MSKKLTMQEFMCAAAELKRVHIDVHGISATGDYPDAFEPEAFTIFANDVLVQHGVLEYVKSGVYKTYTDTMLRATYAYDFNEWDFFAKIKNLRAYEIFDIYQNWYLINDDVDLVDPENEKDTLRAINGFNQLRNDVLNLSVEEAILIAMQTERQHLETGGMCHDCDNPPLTVQYVIENQKTNNPVNALINSLGIEPKDPIAYLEFVSDLKKAMTMEITSVDYPEIEF